MRCFNASTCNGITFRSVLSKAAYVMQRCMRRRQGVQIAEIIGIYRPLQYITKAADAAAEFSSGSVTASSKRNS